MSHSPLKRNQCQDSAQCIGILAGTATDTELGLTYLQSKNIRGVGVSASANPQSQTQLQALSRDALTQLTIDSISSLVEAGADSIMIYCNSLSGAVDLSRVREAVPVRVVTPLETYHELTERYRNFGLLAANCQSCANIEREILACNPTAKVIGIGNLQIVEDIEARLDPSLIIKLHALPDMAQALMKSGVQILIMGCTHFDYIYPELCKTVRGFDLFLPSDRMLQILLNEN